MCILRAHILFAVFDIIISVITSFYTVEFSWNFIIWKEAGGDALDYTVSGSKISKSIVIGRLYDFVNQLGMLNIAHYMN